MATSRLARLGSCASGWLHAAELEADWDRAQDLEPLVAIDPLPNFREAMSMMSCA